MCQVSTLPSAVPSLWRRAAKGIAKHLPSTYPVLVVQEAPQLEVTRKQDILPGPRGPQLHNDVIGAGLLTQGSAGSQRWENFTAFLLYFKYCWGSPRKRLQTLWRHSQILIGLRGWLPSPGLSATGAVPASAGRTRVTDLLRVTCVMTEHPRWLLASPTAAAAARVSPCRVLPQPRRVSRAAERWLTEVASWLRAPSAEPGPHKHL